MTPPRRRYGMTIPFDDVPLAEQRDWIVELEDLGYTDVWSSEANGADAITPPAASPPPALAAVGAPPPGPAPASAPAYTRGPALLAQQVATLAAAAPGRFAFGLGTSSDVIVERWNGLEFDDPYYRVRDTVRFLRSALTGAKTNGDYRGFASHGFRLGVKVPDEGRVPIFVAALREGMLRLAGREADGAIINWLSANDVATVAPIVHAHGEGKEIVARIFVAPTTDRDTVMALGRYAIAAYLSVPVYAEFHRWLGRGEQLAEMWRLWADGDRQGALAAIPDSLVDELIVWGTPEQCREHLDRYADNGVTTPVIALLPFGYDQRQAIRDLAPR